MPAFTAMRGYTLRGSPEDAATSPDGHEAAQRLAPCFANGRRCGEAARGGPAGLFGPGAPHATGLCSRVCRPAHREHPRGVLLSRVHLLFSAKFQVVLDSVNVPQTHAFKHGKRRCERITVLPGKTRAVGVRVRRFVSPLPSQHSRGFTTCRAGHSRLTCLTFVLFSFQRLFRP